MEINKWPNLFSYQYNESFLDIFAKYDDNFQQLDIILNKFKKFNVLNKIKKKLAEELRKIFANNFYSLNANEIENLVKQKKLKFSFEYLRKPQPYNYSYDEKEEKKLQESLKNIEDLQNIDNILWKSCREILELENVVILPEKIDSSNFNQGYIGDCYFISCVNALSRIPQLLNFIMRLPSKIVKNKVETNLFTVNFFIDGEWKIVNIKDSFPCYKNGNKYELIGVKPKSNELFMMILEKAWAQINGGYDQIEGGQTKNIFELFLGCSCDSVESDSDEVFGLVKKNEEQFGTLTLCSAIYYKETKELHNNLEYNNNLCKTYIKQNLINENLLEENGRHAYTILKTFEMSLIKDNDQFETSKFLIISNPHGRDSNLLGSGIELKKIKEIIENEFGINKNHMYQYILDINDNYQISNYDGNIFKYIHNGTGIIYMPLKYFQEWSSKTFVCRPHYDCISYIYNINNTFQNLYIFKLKLNEEQSFTCQVCFQSYRAHRDKIDKIKIMINYENNNPNIINLEEKLLLNYNYCGIKIIKNDGYLSEIGNYCSYNDDYDYSSIKELNSVLEHGEYFIMIYSESSIDKCLFRFLVEKEIEIKLINTFDVMQKKIDNINKYTIEQKNVINNINKSTENLFMFLFKYNNNSNNYNNKNQCYKFFLNSESLPINILPQRTLFLPGIKKFYSNFKALAQSKGLRPEEAIYSISLDGEAIFYDIIEINSFNKIYGERKVNGITKYDIIDINTLQFRDNQGYPYKVKNFKELIHEMKINREPINCLFTEYDENSGAAFSGSTYFKLYYNKAKNEDILVVTDKSGNYKLRKHSPLFIIILDISGSMSEFYDYLQHQLIPQLLFKLDYYWKEDGLYDILCQLKVKNLELLQAISSKYKLDNFIKKYNFENILRNKNLKYLCDDIIPLITFSDDSKLYFFTNKDFQKNSLSGDNTNFEEAANWLKKILNSVSRERSIRLLSFSDGEIHDIYPSMKVLEEILNSPKTKHQMNSVSVRVCHGTEPDTKILMKLSAFSHPICDMTQIVINPQIDRVNDVVEKLYNLFKDDGMKYNLKLYSDIFFMSTEFTDKFSKEQYLNGTNTVIRMKNHTNLSNYQKYLKISIGDINIEDCGELKEEDFYDIMSNNAPFIAQKILERKVNKNENSNENEQIIDYFKITENYYENMKINLYNSKETTEDKPKLKKKKKNLSNFSRN